MFDGMNKNNTAEVGKRSNQPRENSGIESVALNAAQNVLYAIRYLWVLHENTSLSPEGVLSFLMSLRDNISRIEEENPAAKNLTIMKFLHSIAENDELHRELKDLNNFAKNCDGTPGSTNYQEFYSQLRKIITGVELPNLVNKINFLLFMKEKRDFASILKGFRDLE